MPNRYFRREWDELRSGDHPHWGAATFYFETDESLAALRQVEVYANGRRLRYDRAPCRRRGRLPRRRCDLPCRRVARAVRDHGRRVRHRMAQRPRDGRPGPPTHRRPAV